MMACHMIPDHIGLAPHQSASSGVKPPTHREPSVIERNSLPPVMIGHILELKDETVLSRRLDGNRLENGAIFPRDPRIIVRDEMRCWTNSLLDEWRISPLVSFFHPVGFAPACQLPTLNSLRVKSRCLEFVFLLNRQRPEAVVSIKPINDMGLLRLTRCDAGLGRFNFSAAII